MVTVIIARFRQKGKCNMREYPLPPPEKDSYIRLSDAYKYINEAFFDGFIVAICDSPDDLKNMTATQRIEACFMAIALREQLTK